MKDYEGSTTLEPIFHVGNYTVTVTAIIDHDNEIESVTYNLVRNYA